MNKVLIKILFGLFIQLSLSFTQNIVKVGQGENEIKYFDKYLNLYFSTPLGWRAETIESGIEVYKKAIGLVPKDWNYSTTSSGDTLSQSPYAITILVQNGSIETNVEDVPKDKIVELKKWRYYQSYDDARLYLKGGGYVGLDNFYWSISDNRQGKCVWINADPLYKEVGVIFLIESSLSFK